MSLRAPHSTVLLFGALFVLGSFAISRLSCSPASPLSPLPDSSQPPPGALRVPAPSSSTAPAIRPGAVRQLGPTLLLDQHSRLWSYMKAYGGPDLCFGHEEEDTWPRAHRTVNDAIAVAPMAYPDGLCSLDTQGDVQCCQRPPRSPIPGPFALCWRGIGYSSDTKANTALLVSKPGQPAPLDPLCQDGSFVPLLHDVQEITGAATSHCLQDYAFDGSRDFLLCGVTPTCALRRDGTVVCWTSLDKPPYPVATPAAWGKVTHVQISDQGQLVVSTDDGHVASSTRLLREPDGDELSRPAPLVRRPVETIQFQTLFKLPAVAHLSAGAERCASQAQGETWCARQVPYSRQKHPYERGIGAIAPRRMRDLGEVRSLSSNDNHSCAVDQAGQLRCWGLRMGMPTVFAEDDREENLRGGDYFDQPVRVRTRRPARQVAVLAHSTCVALDDESLQCLGTELRSFMGVH